MIKWKSGRAETSSFSVPEENPVTIYVNNRLLSTLMVTPAQLKELAAGFLYSENIIDSAGEITGISVEQDKRRSQVWIDADIKELTLEKMIITSGCGRGITFFCPSDIEGLEPLNSNLSISPDEITSLAKDMLSAGAVYRNAGGIHSCAISDTKEILSFSEDIGRHNAVDKALGDCLLRGIDLRDKIIFSTGRISSEMLLKAFRTKIPVVCSLTSPTNLTVELGGKLGMTVIGYIRGGGMKIYTHPSRVFASPAAVSTLL